MKTMNVSLCHASSCCCRNVCPCRDWNWYHRYCSCADPDLCPCFPTTRTRICAYPYHSGYARCRAFFYGDRCAPLGFSVLVVFCVCRFVCPFLFCGLCYSWFSCLMMWCCDGLSACCCYCCLLRASPSLLVPV
uniref:Uncharacterized protein n=1 Tax=Anopheles darlingi TaxID=43151 RepID=A0A2M4CVB9_ANODA